MFSGVSPVLLSTFLLCLSFFYALFPFWEDLPLLTEGIWRCETQNTRSQLCQAYLCKWNWLLPTELTDLLLQWMHGNQPLVPTSYASQLPKHCAVWVHRVMMSSSKGRDGSPDGSVLPDSRDSTGVITLQPVVSALTRFPPEPPGVFKRAWSILTALLEKEKFASYNLWKQTMYPATWRKWGVPKKVCTPAECRNFKCFLFSIEISNSVSI